MACYSHPSIDVEYYVDRSNNSHCRTVTSHADVCVNGECFHSHATYDIDCDAWVEHSLKPFKASSKKCACDTCKKAEEAKKCKCDACKKAEESKKCKCDACKKAEESKKCKCDACKKAEESKKCECDACKASASDKALKDLLAQFTVSCSCDDCTKKSCECHACVKASATKKCKEAKEALAKYCCTAH
jgi:membrane protein involved in colicin uptake